MLTLLEESAVRFQLELFIVRAPVGLGGRCPSSPSWSSLLPSSAQHTMMEQRGGNIYWGRIFKGVNLSTVHSYYFIQIFIPLAYIYLMPTKRWTPGRPIRLNKSSVSSALVELSLKGRSHSQRGPQVRGQLSTEARTPQEWPMALCKC